MHTGKSPVVICGVDDERADEGVVRFAADMSKRLGGRLILLHVQPLPLSELEPQIAYAASHATPGRDLLAAARRLARLAADAGVAQRTDVRVGHGDLMKQLLMTAGDEAAAVLIVGSGPGRRSRRMQRLVDGGAVPVFVVPVVPRRPAAASTSADWGRKRMDAGRARGDAAGMGSTGERDMRGSLLCGVDGSRQARVALRYAARLARMLGTRLVVAHVVQPPRLPSSGVGPMARQLMTVPIDELLDSGEALLDTILAEEGIGDVERRVVFGFPGNRLAAIAEEEAVELVVIGSRGRGAIRAALLGSVSTDLIGLAHRPVIVVPSRTPVPGLEEDGWADVSSAGRPDPKPLVAQP